MVRLCLSLVNCHLDGRQRTSGLGFHLYTFGDLNGLWRGLDGDHNHTRLCYWWLRRLCWTFFSGYLKSWQLLWGRLYGFRHFWWYNDTFGCHLKVHMTCRLLFVFLVDHNRARWRSFSLHDGLGSVLDRLHNNFLLESTFVLLNDLFSLLLSNTGGFLLDLTSCARRFSLTELLLYLLFLYMLHLLFLFCKSLRIQPNCHGNRFVLAVNIVAIMLAVFMVTMVAVFDIFHRRMTVTIMMFLVGVH